MTTSSLSAQQAQSTTSSGRPHPLGATPNARGVNFSLFSESATSVELLIFKDAQAEAPCEVIRLDPKSNKTFHFWHILVHGLKPGAFYGYRVGGPNASEQGHRFDKEKVLLDPYARGICATRWDRGAACEPGDNAARCMHSVVIDTTTYNWEGDRPLRRPMEETIIYETHVGGFTRSPSSNSKAPGTYAAVIEKIPYLQKLGITAVELMPVFDFDESETVRIGPDGKALVNYWGYSTIGFFAPHNAFCQNPQGGGHADEFRDLVKALHKAGIEVILDVVFNHTSEGNENGPTINLRGIENSVYYDLEPSNRQYYSNYSGCGNTVSCNHPIVEKLIVESLEFWVQEMHVDGFRFDEGSILSRDSDGRPLQTPPLLWQIELSEVLADTKIIAEAWDAGGLNQVGRFPGNRWSEWNGCYRDDIRRFVRGDRGLAGAVATRIGGSADLYQWNGRLPINSINFVTAHDGFTLYDLVAYNGKHNEANGEGNRDGVDDNLSWNCGWEGESDDPNINSFRKQQIRNFATLLLLSQGVPMFVAGDEVGRTQQGNNNAYCQDNAISWFDWTLVEKNGDLLDFFQKAIALRKRHPSLQRRHYFEGTTNERGLADISWHGCELNAPPWSNPASGILAFTLGGHAEEPDLHVMLNMEEEPLSFQLPTLPSFAWVKVLDTTSDESGCVDSGSCTVRPRSIVAVESKNIDNN